MLLIVLVNDTGSPPVNWRIDDRVRVVDAASGAKGGYGGLFIKILQGCRVAVEESRCDLILKLDTDALVIGPLLSERVSPFFSADATLGVLGSYTTGPSGGRRIWRQAAQILRHEAGITGLRHYRLRRALRAARKTALPCGYVDGEHVLGGAYVLRAAFAEKLCGPGGAAAGPWSESRLGEDHLMGLFALSLGYRLGDFSGPGDPFAIEWRGLSADPAELCALGKILIHSVDFSNSMTEGEIRSFFRKLRL